MSTLSLTTKRLLLLGQNKLQVIPKLAALHTTNVLNKKVAGRHSPTRNRDKPLSYEESFKPNFIGHVKSWNSISNNNLIDGKRKPETAHEDLFIRKFLHGTWPRLLASPVIIKRRANQIICNFVFVRRLNPRRIYFLIGYTEEILCYILKCPVKLELQSVDSELDLVYRYI